MNNSDDTLLREKSHSVIICSSVVSVETTDCRGLLILNTNFGFFGFVFNFTLIGYCFSRFRFPSIIQSVFTFYGFDYDFEFESRFFP